MTNAEAAAHFAKQPPDQEAKIFIINGDTCTMSEEVLEGLVAAEDLDEVDDPDQDAIGHPFVYLKW